MTYHAQCDHACYVRFGSKADICSAQAHVLFTPESDIKRDIWECPLWANSGHTLDYSITSSARASNETGIEIPVARAVFKFITSSNFAGCCTGRSDGLAPFRMRST